MGFNMRMFSLDIIALGIKLQIKDFNIKINSTGNIPTYSPSFGPQQRHVGQTHQRLLSDQCYIKSRLAVWLIKRREGFPRISW